MTQRIGGAIQTRVEIVDFRGLMQAEVAIGQFDFIAGGNVPAPVQRRRQRLFEHLRVTRGTDAVCEHAMKRHLGPEIREAEHDRAEGLRHRHRRVTASTGTPNSAARSALSACRRRGPSRLRSGSGRLRPRPAREDCGRLLADHPQIQRQHRRAAARERIIGSRESGPVLNTRTRRPSRHGSARGPR